MYSPLQIQGDGRMKDLTSYVYSFEEMIQGNFLYVDKTEYIWQLIRPSRAGYFLSRPRRFGKSLTISTLKAVFEGKKDLFKGLAIYDKPYDWKPYPVIHLDLNGFDFGSIDAVRSSLCRLMRETAAIHHLHLNESKPEQMFREIITELSKKNEIVILLDEYDKPILNNIGKPECKQILADLKAFYSVIKAFEGKLRFAFITGVSKFCHVSLFSDLNNLTDITMDARYATMLGYTQTEFESNFREQIDAASQKLGMPKEELLPEIKAWYDGFRFEEDAESVYNPVSLASFFEKDGKFNNYWFETGTPKFLVDLAKNQNFDFGEKILMGKIQLLFRGFDHLLEIRFKFFLGVAEHGGELGIHGDVCEIIQIGEQRDMTEFAHAGNESEAEFSFKGFYHRIKSFQVCQNLPAFRFADIVQNRLVVFIQQNNDFIFL